MPQPLPRSPARLVAEAAMERLRSSALAEHIGDRWYYAAARALVESSPDQPIVGDACYCLVDRTQTEPAGSGRRGRYDIEVAFVVTWSVEDRLSTTPAPLYWLDVSEEIFTALEQDSGVLVAEIDGQWQEITEGVLGTARAQSPLPVPGSPGLLMADVVVRFRTTIHLETRQITR